MADGVEKKSHRVLGEMLVPPVIARAIVAIQKDLEPLTKSETNDEYGSGFVPLEAVAAKAYELLAERKIAVMQPAVTDENGHLALKTMLVHETGVGYQETTRLALPKADPQGHGSAITYMRRYGLMAMLGLTAKNEDDDANKASGVTAKATPEQIDRIKSLLRHMKFPPDQIAHEVRNIYTRDHASEAIINYENMMSVRARDREAEANAIEAGNATHVDVVDASDEPTVEERIKALGLKSKAYENKFVHYLVGKPMLANCTEADLQEIAGYLDLVETDKRKIPAEWYAASEETTNGTAAEEEEA